MSFEVAVSDLIAVIAPLYASNLILHIQVWKLKAKAENCFYCEKSKEIKKDVIEGL